MLIGFGIVTALFVGILTYVSLTTSEEDDGGHERMFPAPVLLPAPLQLPAETDDDTSVTDPFRKEGRLQDDQDPECFQSSQLIPWTFRSLSNELRWEDMSTSEWVYRTPLKITFVDGLGQVQVAFNKLHLRSGWYCRTSLRPFDAKTQRLLTNTLLHNLGPPPPTKNITNVDIWLFLDRLDPNEYARRARYDLTKDRA